MLKKGLALISVVLLGGLLMASAVSAAVKFESYDSAISEAADQDKHVMIYFWAPWCQYCTMFNEDVLPNEKVAAALASDFLAVQVNIEDDPQGLAKKYGARTLPMIVFLNSEGELAGYLPGYVPPEGFMEILGYIKDKSYLN